MGVMKRYYGRRKFAPACLAVADARVKPPRPDFYRHVPDPVPETGRTTPPGPARQAKFPFAAGGLYRYDRR
jgi:hypothetical protein